MTEHHPRIPIVLPARIRLPDAVIIGAARSGTTTLARRLAEHQDIFFCPIKEPEFFSHDDNFARGLGWYGALFDGARDDQLCVEASTSYTRNPQYPDAARRLHSCCPHAKIIYLMRHPVERAYSHFIHRYTKELYRGLPIDRTFDQHVLEDQMCIDSSDYRLQIAKMLEHYPRSQMLFLFTHELAADESATLGKIYDFLGLEPARARHRNPGERLNAGADYLDSRVRIDVTNRIKAWPGVKRLLPLVPLEVREFGYGCLRRFGLGRELANGMVPPPLHPMSRKLLLKRYHDSNRWVADFLGADLSCWDR